MKVRTAGEAAEAVADGAIVTVSPLYGAGRPLRRTVMTAPEPATP